MSILPASSKIFEKLVFEKITVFIDPLLSKFQCSFRKSFHYLVSMLDHWKSEVYNEEKVFGKISKVLKSL